MQSCFCRLFDLFSIFFRNNVKKTNETAKITCEKILSDRGVQYQQEKLDILKLTREYIISSSVCDKRRCFDLFFDKYAVSKNLIKKEDLDASENNTKSINCNGNSFLPKSEDQKIDENTDCSNDVYNIISNENIDTDDNVPANLNTEDDENENGIVECTSTEVESWFKMLDEEDSEEECKNNACTDVNENDGISSDDHKNEDIDDANYEHANEDGACYVDDVDIKNECTWEVADKSVCEVADKSASDVAEKSASDVAEKSDINEIADSKSSKTCTNDTDFENDDKYDTYSKCSTNSAGDKSSITSKDDRSSISDTDLKKEVCIFDSKKHEANNFCDVKSTAEKNLSTEDDEYNRKRKYELVKGALLIKLDKLADHVLTNDLYGGLVFSIRLIFAIRKYNTSNIEDTVSRPVKPKYFYPLALADLSDLWRCFFSIKEKYTVEEKDYRLFVRNIEFLIEISNLLASVDTIIHDVAILLNNK